MNTIELQTTISVQTFDAPATVAIGRNAPEWLAVARLAKDLGGTIRAEEITAELLGGLPSVIGKRVIERSVALGLLDHTEPERKEGLARLSALGEHALALGQVFISQEGIWRFYYAEDALLSQPLLHIERLDDGSAKDEREQLRKLKQQGNIPIDQESWPTCLLQAQHSAVVINSIADAAPNFILKDSSEAGVHSGEQPLRLSLSWDSDAQPELFLTGKLTRPLRRTKDKGDQNPVTSSPLEVHRRLSLPTVLSGVNHEEVWMKLVALGANLETSSLHHWRQRTGRLVMPMTFAGCKPAARNSFKQDLPVPRIPKGQFAGMEWLEGFDPSTLVDVELVPASEQDAQPWAEWLLRESLNDYATPDRLKALAAKARQRFEFHSPLMPDPEALLSKALANSTDPQSHFILAPYDLGLWN